MPHGLSNDEQESLKRFPALAKEFCEFIEICEDLERPRLIQELSVRLAGLCETAARLPLLNPSTTEDDLTAELISEHVDQWQRMSAGLREQLGDMDAYWDVFDPTQREETVQSSLSIDIADIYLDLKDALRLQTSGATIDDIYFDWRLDFRQHWSRHAASALRVLLILSNRV
ncbi:MAG TPA: DUF5063 domain-containing protein [Candidatus Acidoferrum sp.]|nr:DUF5063 domain-containing protein [Candidatus Acidoferrum sp.]